MSIKIKIILGFAFSLAVMLIITVTSINSAQTIAKNTHWVTHTFTVLGTLEQLVSHLKDTETGQRGFLITAKEGYLEPYHSGKKAVFKDLDRVQELTSDNATQQERISKLRPLVQAKFDELADTIELRRTKGFDAALAVVLTDEGKVVMDQIRVIYDQMVADEQRLMKIRSAGTASKAENVILLVCALGFIGTLIIGTIITLNIVRPINEIVKKIDQMSQGDLTVKIENDSNDEIGTMSQALKGFIGGLQSTFSTIQKNSQNLTGASTELASISSQMSGAITEVTAQVNSVADSSQEMSRNFETVSNDSSEMTRNIDSISATSTEMAANIDSIAATSTEMSLNMETVNKEVSGMSQSIRDVADKANNALSITQQAEDQSLQATSVMNSLGNSADEIGDVTSMIKTIAEQTNLLALNANIEAASAGEAGKGFAVVANEIKELAKQSAGAAQDISNKISDIQNQAKESIATIETISKVITEVSLSSTEINKLAEEQSGSSISIVNNIQENTQAVEEVAKMVNEMAATTSDVNQRVAEMANTSVNVSGNIANSAKSTQEITKNITEIASASNQTASGSQQVNEQAVELSTISEELNSLVNQFKVN